MTKYWDSAYQLALHAGNALSGLIASNPRPGLVSGKLLPSEDVAREIARLSAENRLLTEQLNELRSEVDQKSLTPDEQLLMEELERVTIHEAVAFHVPDIKYASRGPDGKLASCSPPSASLWDMICLMNAMPTVSFGSQELYSVVLARLGWRMMLAPRYRPLDGWQMICAQLTKVGIFTTEGLIAGDKIQFKVSPLGEKLIKSRRSVRSTLLGELPRLKSAG